MMNTLMTRGAQMMPRLDLRSESQRFEDGPVSSTYLRKDSSASNSIMQSGSRNLSPLRYPSPIKGFEEAVKTSGEDSGQLSPLNLPRTTSKNSVTNSPLLSFRESHVLGSLENLERNNSINLKARLPTIAARLSEMTQPEEGQRSHRPSVREDSLGLPGLRRHGSVGSMDESMSSRLNASSVNSSVLLATSRIRLEELKKSVIPNFERRHTRDLNENTYQKIRGLNGMDPPLGLSKEVTMSEHERQIFEKMKSEVRAMMEGKPIREIKILKWENFHIIKEDKVFLKIATRGKPFPMVIRIEFSGEKSGVFDAYVSKRVSKPSAERHDFKFTTANFEFYYSEHTKIEWIYITIQAVTTLDFSLIAFFSEARSGLGYDDAKDDEKVDWQELFMKNMKRLQAKKKRKHYLDDLNADELQAMKEEVCNTALFAPDFLIAIDWIKEKRRAEVLSLARGGVNRVEENIKTVKDYRDIIETNRRSQSVDREKKFERVLSTKELIVQEKMAHKVMLLQKRDMQRQIFEMMTRRKNEKIRRAKLQRKWAYIMTFGFLMESLERNLWLWKLRKMIFRGYDRAARKIQKAYRSYIDRRDLYPKQRLIGHIRGMLTAYCVIREKKVVPAAEKLAAKVLRTEIFRSFCTRKIIMMCRNAIVIQRFFRRWIPVLRARMFVLHKFLRQIQAETKIQVEVLKAAGESKKKRKAKQGEEENKIKLIGQLLSLLNKLDTDPELMAKWIRSYIQDSTMDFLDEVKEFLELLKEKKREKDRERRAELQKTKARLQEIEEKKAEELSLRKRSRIGRPSLKYAPVLASNLEITASSKAKLVTASKNNVLKKIAMIAAFKRADSQMFGLKKPVLLFFKKDELIEFLEEKLRIHENPEGQENP